jgi:glutamate-1-semialdehyde 2,1-aminomutase|tara:strand:- start:12763 stop:14829 length:2067 start_codon:yes stop_codon:yes gene_type:complete
MVKKLNIVAVVQARLTSKRFPKKVISKIGNYSLIEIIKKRLDRSKLLDKVVYAIPKNQENKNLEIFLKQKNIEYHSGSEKNVLKRYIQTAIKFDADIIVRITSDCPLVCPKMLDNMIHEFKKKKVDYLSNIKDPLNIKDEFYYPDGFDIEIFSKKSLLSSYKKISSSFDYEHVTTFIRSSNIFKKHFVKSQKKFQKLKLSVDTKKDLNNVKKIFKVFASNIFFSFEDILKNKKSLDIIKKQLIRKNMLSKKVKKSQSLWSKANKIIPGGNMLLSKNPDRYLPKLWPTYFKNADGCNVTDLDNNKYIDFSTMGVGTNVLGYGNTLVDNAVKNTIKKGNLSTLNCPEEVYLAEKLIEIHPWFDMVKFARTGGEANSIAIRIARVASARDNVAVCGYHGWHDWYLSTNLNKNKKNNLDQHLMKNLQISGVPKKLKNTVFSFHYGDFITLKNLVTKKKIGVIKMEVCRNTEPNIKFLKKVRQLATKNKIVLIFDECTTAFRETYGGLHKKINIYPDVAIFGKTLGNGYAISAIIGKKEVMVAAKETFISSTFWTERIGPTAALKTLQIMQNIKSWRKIRKIGKKIAKKWRRLFDKYNLIVEINGIPSLLSFTFKSNKHQAYKTLITQEMLKKNFLATNTIYPCIKHNDKLIDRYFVNLEKIIKIISQCENEGQDIKKFLDSDVSSKDFYRYN